MILCPRAPVVATSQQQQQASLQDFVHFHGMLCRPTTAARCIRAFDGGTILFLPHDYTYKATAVSSDSLSTYDCSGGALTVASYYALVVCSLTGLWTWMGRTKFLLGRQEGEKEPAPKLTLSTRAEYNSTLQVDATIIDYLHQQNPTAKEFVVVRRFEYDFVGLLSVVMLHLQCQPPPPPPQGNLHLVEIYQIPNPVLRTVGRNLLAVLGWFTKLFLVRLPKIVLPLSSHEKCQ